MLTDDRSVMSYVPTPLNEPTALPPLRSLPRISRPDVARAARDQICLKVSTPTPMYVVPPRDAERCHVKAPHPRASQRFVNAHDAFLCANFLSFCTPNVSVEQLLRAEEVELEAASLHAGHGACGDDGSLAPRRVALWIHVQDVSSVRSMHCWRLLELVAHWSLQLASLMRTTFVAGADAEVFRRHVERENNTCYHEHGRAASHGHFGLSLRWQHARSDRSTVSVIAAFPRLSSSDHLAKTLHRAVVDLIQASEEALPNDVVAALLGPVKLPVPKYNVTLQSVYDSFVALTTSPDVASVAEAPSTPMPVGAARHDPKAVRLARTNTYVRVCPRRRNCRVDYTAPQCFHGFIMTSEGMETELDKFARQRSCDDGGLPLPPTVFGTHLCAVQSELRRLDARASLYGPRGTPSALVAPPGTSVWTTSAAIRPIDAGLLAEFVLLPCTVESIAPAEATLRPPFEQSFARASKLCERVIRRGASTSSATVDTSVMGTSYEPTSRAERFGVIDLACQRSTLGEVLSRAWSEDPRAPLTRCLLEACRRVGPSAGLDEAFKLLEGLARQGRDVVVAPLEDAPRPQMPQSYTFLHEDVCDEPSAATATLASILSHATTVPRNSSMASHARQLLQRVRIARGALSDEQWLARVMDAVATELLLVFETVLSTSGGSTDHHVRVGLPRVVLAVVDERKNAEGVTSLRQIARIDFNEGRVEWRLCSVFCLTGGESERRFTIRLTKAADLKTTAVALATVASYD